MAIPLNDLRLLPRDVLNHTLVHLTFRDMSTLACVCRLFRDLVKSYYENKATQLGITVKALNIQQEISIYCELQEQFAFVNKILGPMAPSAVKQIPVVHFVHTKNIVRDWLKGAPQASIIRGTKYETHLHRSINFVAFFVQDHPRRAETIIMARELPDQFMAWQKEYLQRLVRHLPCGSLQRPLSGEAIEEEHRVVIRRKFNDQKASTKRYRASAVELSHPSGEDEKSLQFFRSNPGNFIYF